MAVIEVEGLVKRYGDVTALHEVGLTVDAGELVAILGPNGAGKTTTVEILEGLRARDAGRVEVLGDDPAHRPRGRAAQVGVVFQETAHDPFLTVGETADLVRGWYDDPLSRAEALALVGLDDVAATRTSRLSGGQRRRLDVALGLVGRPSLLFLDEPTTGFDPAARREAWMTIHRLRDEGTTIVLTTHYLDEAAALADRLIVLARGRVVADGAPDSIGRRNERYVVSFRPPPTSRDLPPGGMTVDGRWATTVNDITATVGQLHGWAARCGHPLDDLAIGRPPLEDIYLELIA